MLVILRSRAAFSLLSGSFGSLRFFSSGTSPARGCRWPTGACTVGAGLSEFFGTDDELCANALGQPIRIISAIDRIVLRILVLRFLFCLSHQIFKHRAII